MASKADVEAGRAFVRLFLKNDMSKALSGALRAASNQLRSFGQSAVSMGRSIAMAGAAASAPFVLSVRTFASFDDAMREVAAVTQAGEEDFARLTKKAKELGASTSYTAIQVGSLMAELGRAGFDPKQIEAMTGAVLALSRATSTDAPQSAGIMSAAIRQFRLEAEDAGHVADVLTAGANKSFNTLETLGEALTYAGPIANDFNMSLEDTVAVLGTLGNLGIQGSNAGTALRRMLTLTGAEAKRLQNIFGVSFVDASGNARPLVDSLQDVADATKGMGTASRSAKFNEAFGLLGITGASALSKNITGTRELRKAIGEAGGTAQKTADMMDSGLGGAFRILWSAIEGVQISIGEALEPVLTNLAKRITIISQGMINWVKANQATVLAVAASAAGAVALGAALVGIGTAALIASTVLGGLASIVGMVLSPLGLITAAVVGATVAFFKWTEAGQAAYQTLSATFGELLKWFRYVFDGISAAMSAGDMQLAAEVMWAGIKVAWIKGIGWVRTQWAELRFFVVDTWGKVSFSILDTLNFLWSGMVDGFWTAIDEIVDAWKWAEKSFAKGIGWVLAKLQGLDPNEVLANIDQDYGREQAGRDTGRVERDRANQEAADARYAANEASRQEWLKGAGAKRDSDLAGAELGLDEASKKLESAVTSARARREEKEREQATKAAEQSAEQAATSGGNQRTVTQPAGAPGGVALTATYSAAAARISGYQPQNGPEEKMAKGIDAVEKNTKEMVQQQRRFLDDQAKFYAMFMVN
jgi:TP901 family phage tail tape measure protein